MEKIDIYRCADLMIKQHGNYALIEVMNKIEELRSKGDTGGMSLWNKVADAIHWLQETDTTQTCH